MPVAAIHADRFVLLDLRASVRVDLLAFTDALTGLQLRLRRTPLPGLYVATAGALPVSKLGLTRPACPLFARHVAHARIPPA